jgi:hypothetical protein
MRPERRLRGAVGTGLRGATVAAALLGYLAATFGFPVVVPARAGKDGCHQRACGCIVTDEHQSCCCDPAPKTVTRSCCARPVENCPHCDGEAPESCCEKKAASDGPVVAWVVGPQARQCRGLDTLWFSLGAVLPPTAPVTAAADLVPAGTLVHVASSLDSLSWAPPSPPPRG